MISLISFEDKSSTILGSIKYAMTKSIDSFGFKVCCSKQKQLILLKYLPALAGTTLKVEIAVEVSFPKFLTLNLIVETCPGFIFYLFFSALNSQNNPFDTLVSKRVAML